MIKGRFFIILNVIRLNNSVDKTSGLVNGMIMLPSRAYPRRSHRLLVMMMLVATNRRHSGRKGKGLGGFMAFASHTLSFGSFRDEGEEEDRAATENNNE